MPPSLQVEEETSKNKLSINAGLYPPLDMRQDYPAAG